MVIKGCFSIFPSQYKEGEFVSVIPEKKTKG